MTNHKCIECTNLCLCYAFDEDNLDLNRIKRLYPGLERETCEDFKTSLDKILGLV